MCKHLLKIQRLILALLIFGGGIFYTSSATARVCFLPDSTDCGEGDVDVPEVQITCATYGGYETEAACLEARTNKTAQTCTLNSGCYYPKCAYDSERNCKNANSDKNCLSQDVDGVKCWYSQPKTCSEQGYKTSCGSDETATKVDVEASNAPCYTCAKKKTCKMMNYYGSKDNCPNPTSNYERKETNYTDKDGDKCYTCEPKACTKLNASYKNKYNKDTCGSGKKSQKVDGTDSAADGPCYTCVDKGDGSYDYIIYIDDTQSQENDKVTISRSVYSTDRNATFDAESVADVTEERCDWNCNCDEGGTSISLANGKTATYWDVNEEAGGGSSGECDYTRTYVSWNYTKVTVNGTTKEYKNTQCKDGTITDSKGTVYKIVCGIPTCSGIGYQTTPCSTGYKQIDYIQLPHENCYKCEKSKVTITIALDATNTTVSFSTSASDSKGYTVKLSLNGGGNDGITYPVVVSEGRTATYFSSTYEDGDCDVHGDNCDNDLGNGRETVSAASNLSVIINDQTVLRNLTTENEYLDMRYFIGKTYDTDNYIIKFVKAQTCSDLGYQTTPCSTGYKQIDYIQLPHEDCYKCEIKKGWGIHYTHEVEDLDTRTYSCTITEDDGGVKADVSTRWKVSVYKKGTASEVEALDGKKYAYIDQHKGEVRYPKGEYNICFDYGRDVYIRPYYIHLATKDEDACDYSWDEDDGRWHPDYNNYDNINKGFCSDENIMTFGGITCMTATFEDNEEYYVQGDFEGNNIDGISEWECTPIATASH